MRVLLIAFLAAATLMTSCKEDTKIEGSENDYLIFGTYYGFCAGNCTLLYKIDEEFLYEDDVERGVPEEVPFLPTPREEEDFLLAEELVASFPDDLIESDKEVYGCPDCADQGGVYLEMRKGIEIRKWHLDTGDAEQSDEILAYKERLLEIVQLLK